MDGQGAEEAQEGGHQVMGAVFLSLLLGSRARTKRAKLAERLPVSVYSPNKRRCSREPQDVSSDAGSGQMCVICQEDYMDGEAVKTLPCHHSFHDACVSRWLLEEKSSCPLCKRRIAASASDEEEVGADVFLSHRATAGQGRASRELSFSREFSTTW